MFGSVRVSISGINMLMTCFGKTIKHRRRNTALFLETGLRRARVAMRTERFTYGPLRGTKTTTISIVANLIAAARLFYTVCGFA